MDAVDDSRSKQEKTREEPNRRRDPQANTQGKLLSAFQTRKKLHESDATERETRGTSEEAMREVQPDILVCNPELPSLRDENSLTLTVAATQRLKNSVPCAQKEAETNAWVLVLPLSGLCDVAHGHRFGREPSQSGPIHEELVMDVTVVRQNSDKIEHGPVGGMTAKIVASAGLVFPARTAYPPTCFWIEIEMRNSEGVRSSTLLVIAQVHHVSDETISMPAVSETPPQNFCLHVAKQPQMQRHWLKEPKRGASSQK